MQRIVTVLDTALTVNYNDRPISTQKDLDTYKFQFDESWIGYVKTAVFYTDPMMVRHLLIPEDGVVTIPWEILTGKPQVLYIGVFGAKDNIIKPTTFGAVRLREGSYIDGITPLPPTPDVYQQIISAWEGAKTDETERVANENSRKNNFDALVVEYNALKADLQQQITDGTASVDALQVLESQYVAKALALETTYAPRLGSVESQLAENLTEMQSQVDAVVGNLTSDSEVILARGGKVSLNARLEEIVVNGAIIDNFSIAPDKTTFFTDRSKNLLNPLDANVVIGGYYDQNGAYTAAATRNQSGYMPVLGGEMYDCNNISGFTYWYDKNLKYLSYTLPTDFNSAGYFTAPANARFARIICNSASWATTQFEKGITTTPYEPYRAPRIKEELLSGISMSKLTDYYLKVTVKDSDYFKTDKNLFNPNDEDVVIGGYYHNGAITKTTSAAHNETGYIPVVAGENYDASYMGSFIYWFDKDRKYLSTTSPTDFQNTGYLTAPAGAFYARAVVVIGSWATYQFEKGITTTTYDPFKRYLLPDLIPYPHNLDGKKWVSYGDSITAYNTWQTYVLKRFKDLVHVNKGLGGSTLSYYAPNEATTPSFINASRVDAVKVENPDILTIMGGTNDCHLSIPIGTDAEFTKALADKDKTTFKGAYSWLIETLLAWKPSMRIFVMTTMQGTNVGYGNYSKACLDVANFYALPIIDVGYRSGICKQTASVYLLGDGLHPNTVGGQKIAELTMAEFLKVVSW